MGCIGATSLFHPAHQMDKKTNGVPDMWASRSKPKKALDLHPTTGILLQSLIFFPQHCRDRLLQPPASSGAVLHALKRNATPLTARPSLHSSTPPIILYRV